jgi:hypothetical protein
MKTQERNQVLRITRPCRITGKNYTVFTTQEQYDRWQGGELIQVAMPDLRSEDREFLISGMSPDGWDIAMNNHLEGDA